MTMQNNWLNNEDVERVLWFRKIPYTLTVVQYWILYSCYQRGDFVKARQMIADWTPATMREYVKRFIPGSHFYAFGKRHNTYHEAEAAIIAKGFICLGEYIVHSYRQAGD